MNLRERIALKAEALGVEQTGAVTVYFTDGGYACINSPTSPLNDAPAEGITKIAISNYYNDTADEKEDCITCNECSWCNSCDEYH
jgi:hypothetical protein